MYPVSSYRRVRIDYERNGLSRRELSRKYGYHRKTINKMLEFSIPPGYQRKTPPHKPKLAPFIGIIDVILESDKDRPRKQRHTAKRIFERIQDEHGYEGGYTTVKDYVREKRLRCREMFVPLSHPSGHAQADFGEALAVISGIQRKVHYLCIDLPQSDDLFVKAYAAENMEAFCDGHNAAYSYFGGVPLSVLYDNTKLAVGRIEKDGTRRHTQKFDELMSHYLFEARFGRPGKGNDKGKVEGLVGYVRRNFLVPIPRFDSFDSLNRYLVEHCQKRRDKKLRSHKETIGERFKRDREKLLPLPAFPYDACDKVSTRVSSLSLVRYKTNDYSVPVAYGHREVQINAYVDTVIIHCGTEEIARHERSYEKEDYIYDPLHYLPLLEKKVGALDQAAPLQGWELPEEFFTLRRLLESRMGKKGKRQYVQVLRLMETFQLEEVRCAVGESIRLQALSFDAVKHLVLCHIEQRPPRLDLECYPYLPKAQVQTTSATEYMELLEEGVLL
jgi:transposase